jgi:hypothetical protein
MADATISRVRLRDLTRLGRSRTGHGPQAGRRPARALLEVKLGGQLTPRTCDLMASPI